MALSSEAINLGQEEFEKRRNVDKPFSMDVRQGEKVLASVKFRCTPDELAGFKNVLDFVIVPQGLIIYFGDL